MLDRIISIVAELSKAGEPVAIDDLAARHETTPKQIQGDIRALTAASEDAGVDWLSSIAIEQEGDRLSVTSRGPFRRPLRLTMMEMAAVQAGLALEGEAGAPLAAKIAGLLDQVVPGPVHNDHDATVLEAARASVDASRTLVISYNGTDREIEPHAITHHNGRWYIAAWCRKAEGWRSFRVDRVTALIHTYELHPFSWRGTPPGDGVFHSEDVDAVDVRVSPGIARWIAERYPEARPDGEGRVIVTYHVADTRWLVETVLQYGPEAEVVGPPEYREAVRAALS